RDDRGDIYILEMPNQSKKNLRKRSKCYQSISMFDKCTIKEVKKEKRRYDSVVECYVVFLCCFDVSKVFERLRFPIVEEVPGVIYRGDSNMFVNIKNYRLLENDRLSELFRFMVDSSVESLIDWMPSNELRRKVADAEREESMDQTWSISEARLLDKYYDGRDDGYEEGVDLTNRAVIKRMADRGCSIEFIVDMVNVPVEQVKEVLLEGE
ncbi:MAG: hypothetical protein IJP28_02325, partial [Erysipelotrichales bacterium]|nr:hypothetical protein [Erysipelotrichales bacterium]